MNFKRELAQAILDNIIALEDEFYGYVPLNLLVLELNDKYHENDIMNAVDELVIKGMIKKLNDYHVRSCRNENLKF